ncbi:Alpha/Beta hydrolase protein [Aspergillus pseudonomiae]|uniref:Alpha/Beta hydrolase protein n=1 Tax=Aspergillus pseudonomiae TaxID=1506151 RepID=A0A5N7DH95_9EURO|nr:Alpha/Beta hydrolase protein [Aspergillus pseudonomiae]KAE8405585.1 Alpha/Beta hydrolase protein [Aspergillus pseudonomiae]
MSDTDVLNLNVTVPVMENKTKPWPVMVFVHGGNFAGGSPAWPQNDLARFVKRSKELDMPLIAVSISYRVGALGFLTSEELRSSGLTGNNGLRDQITALLWLKSNIGGFGGDPDNITFVGQSAGGVSGMLHLSSKVPLFKRLACLGGQFLAVQPLPGSVHEELYSTATAILELQGLPTEERLKQLQSLPCEDLHKLHALPSRPVLDGDICNVLPTFASLERGIPSTLHQGRCQEIFIGDCAFDASILAGVLEKSKDDIASRFIAHLSETLPDKRELIHDLLVAYSLDSTSSPKDQEAVEAILQFGHDIAFYAPALTIAEAWDGPSYLYHFNEPNPWPGRWQGRSSHLTDLAFLWHNYDEFLSDDQRQTSRQFSADLISFVNGRAPWPAFHPPSASLVRTYGSSSDGSIAGLAMEKSSASGRRAVIFSLIEKGGADLLLEAFRSFLAKC